MVRIGYLSILTNDARPGYVLIDINDEQPEELADSGITTWFIARFKDIEAAQMHTQTAMRRQFKDTNLFKTDPLNAIAAVNAIELSHEQLYLNPDLTDKDRQLIQRNFDKRQNNHRRYNHLMRTVGKIGLVALGLIMFAPLVNRLYRALFG